jgi:hypothetical protein
MGFESDIEVKHHLARAAVCTFAERLEFAALRNANPSTAAAPVGCGGPDASGSRVFRSGAFKNHCATFHHRWRKSMRTRRPFHISWRICGHARAILIAME